MNAKTINNIKKLKASRAAAENQRLTVYSVQRFYQFKRNGDEPKALIVMSDGTYADVQHSNLAGFLAQHGSRI